MPSKILDNYDKAASKASSILGTNINSWQDLFYAFANSDKLDVCRNKLTYILLMIVVLVNYTIYSNQKPSIRSTSIWNHTALFITCRYYG